MAENVRAAITNERHRWRGFDLVCVDKTSLALPECPELLKKFGYQKIRNAYGNVGAELCVAFHAAGRIPFAFSLGKVYTHEKTLLRKLSRRFLPGQLVLIDAGFYAFENFAALIGRGANFLIPARSAVRPKAIRKLGESDYLAEISHAATKEKMTVRFIYVYRDGFRRRRLVTSLLDPTLYPAGELADIYHERWHIETFYRDFKVTMRGNKWHCRTVDSFKKELIREMILVCLIRLAAGEAARRKRVSPGRISFTRAYAEFKLIFLKIINQTLVFDIDVEWDKMVITLSKHVIKIKPGRSFPRDKGEYRKKTRTLRTGKVGRPRKAPSPERQKKPGRPEELKNLKGTSCLLS